MLESLQIKVETHLRDNSNHGQGQVTRPQVMFHQTLVECPLFSPELPHNIGNPNYWQTLVFELMKQIPSAPSEISPKDDKVADRAARHNPEVYDRKYDIVELEQWIRGMDKIFTVAEVPNEKKLNIGTFYLTGKVDIWWNTVKDGLLGLEFTWNKFLEELRAKFYPVLVQRQKEKEFMELRMSGSIIVM